MPHPERGIVVVGSVNLDMTLQTERAPEAGETVRARSLVYAPGGKGANQAVAAARLGGAVRMISRVGDDAAGASCLRNLADNGVDTTAVRPAPDTPQGLAVIILEQGGENRIVIAEGSNAALSPADVEAARPVFEGAAAVLLQNEVSLETTRAAARAARAAGAAVIWNPAPAPKDLPDDLADGLDILLVNEGEAAALAGLPTGSGRDAERAAEALRGRGCRVVVVTLGRDGALWMDANGPVRVPGVPAEVVDTTGAGDTFAGALAVALSEGMAAREALRFANAAAALSVARAGAQGGMPTREEMSRAAG